MINWKRWERLRASHTAKKKRRFGYFYLDPNGGNGDLLYNTCREIIDRGDQDAWSHRALEEVFMCLEAGVRWPDYMIANVQASHHRDQYDMTQDPWIMAYCCAVHLDRKELIRYHVPSRSIFNLPDKWAWRDALLGKTRAYRFWRRIIPYRFLQDFVYVFYGYMDKAYLD
jgi:hypothetical protein